ncbi:MAG TPA: hypothetical protein VMX79_01920 [bacterium]|nr:hypothetical protein [bacterium]
MRRLNIYIWAMLSLLVLLAVGVIIMPAAGPYRPFTIAAALTISAAVAAFFVVRAFWAARRVPVLRSAWGLLSAGTLCWFGGEVINSCHAIGPDPSPEYPLYSDLLWGIGSAFLVAALVIKVVKRPRRVSPQAVAGALATAALALIVTVNFVLVPALRNPALTPGECFLDCFVVSADFVLGALALIVIAVYGGRGMGRPWAQLAVGLIFYAVGDAIHWHLTEAGQHGPAGSLVAALFWTSGYLLVGLGAYYRRLVFKGVIKLPVVDGEVGSPSE